MLKILIYWTASGRFTISSPTPQLWWQSCKLICTNGIFFASGIPGESILKSFIDHRHISYCMKGIARKLTGAENPDRVLLFQLRDITSIGSDLHFIASNMPHGTITLLDRSGHIHCQCDLQLQELRNRST